MFYYDLGNVLLEAMSASSLANPPEFVMATYKY